MNLTRKNAVLERRITFLQKQLEKSRAENSTLRSENQELLAKAAQHQAHLDTVEKTYKEYLDSITELQAMKEQYRQAMHDARIMKKQFNGKFQSLMKQFKKEV